MFEVVHVLNSHRLLSQLLNIQTLSRAKRTSAAEMNSPIAARSPLRRAGAFKQPRARRLPKLARWAGFQLHALAMLAVDHRTADFRASATSSIYNLYASVPDRSSQLAPFPLESEIPEHAVRGGELQAEGEAIAQASGASSATHAVPSDPSSAISLSMHTQSASGSAPSTARRASFSRASGSNPPISPGPTPNHQVGAPGGMSSSQTIQSPGEDDEAFQVRSTCESRVGLTPSAHLLTDRRDSQMLVSTCLASMETASTTASSGHEKGLTSIC